MATGGYEAATSMIHRRRAPVKRGENRIGSKHLAPVVQKVDNTIQRINLYPLDSVIGSPNSYPLDSDLSGG